MWNWDILLFYCLSGHGTPRLKLEQSRIYRDVWSPYLKPLGQDAPIWCLLRFRHVHASSNHQTSFYPLKAPGVWFCNWVKSVKLLFSANLMFPHGPLWTKSCVCVSQGHSHMRDSCHHGHPGHSHSHGPRAAHPFMAGFHGQFGKNPDQAMNLSQQPKKRSHMDDSSSWDIVKASQ